eukprot:TRINITY_DN14752_c0_g1_i1.p1 TRINITY_DN14752_c0_g1~~TRINITY_DN14752_c0_g1_i1.p1  ORF type:complete len:96 (-),score=15.39 TRINITY_DN14752_c0_g1_i1:158-445(-)
MNVLDSETTSNSKQDLQEMNEDFESLDRGVELFAKHEKKSHTEPETEESKRQTEMEMVNKFRHDKKSRFLDLMSLGRLGHFQGLALKKLLYPTTF